MIGAVEISQCEQVDSTGRRCALVSGHMVAFHAHARGDVVDGHLYARGGEDLSEQIRTQLRLDRLTTQDAELAQLRARCEQAERERDEARELHHEKCWQTGTKLIAERDRAIKERDAAIAARDSAVAFREHAEASRDIWIERAEAAEKQRDSAVNNTAEAIAAGLIAKASELRERAKTCWDSTDRREVRAWEQASRYALTGAWRGQNGGG